MAGLLNTIKQASTAAMAASNPAAVLFGVVTAEAPLEIRVDQRFTLPAEFLIVPESLTHYEVPLRHAHRYTDDSASGSSTKTTEPALPEEPLVIRRRLEAGDKVLLLRVQGGQQYVLLDRVVNADDPGV